MKVIRSMYLSDDGQPALAAPWAAGAISLVCGAVVLLTGTLLIPKLSDEATRVSQYLYLGSADAGQADAPAGNASPARIAKADGGSSAASR